MPGQARTFKGVHAAHLAAIAACVLCALLLTALAPANAAFALEYPSESSSSSSSSSASSNRTGDVIQLGNDYLWAGDSTTVVGASVPNDLLGAGQTITVKDCAVNGSIRVAGNAITISGAKVIENVTIAGETLTIQGGSANAVVMASNTSNFAGECNNLTVFANTVRIDGAVHGDVTVNCDNLTVGPDAVIEGALHVNAPNQPSVSSQARVGRLDVTIQENASQEIESALAGLGAAFLVVRIVMGVIGTLVIALLAELLFRRHTAGAAEMIRRRPVPTIATGLVGALVAPLVVILLCCLVVTLPAAGAVVLALFAMTLVAAGFMGASVFKLAFPKLGRIVVALIGGAVIGIASVVPVLGAIVTAVAFMYFLGYVLQSIFLGMRGKPTPVDQARDAAAATATASAAATAPAPAGPAPAAAYDFAAPATQQPPQPQPNAYQAPGAPQPPEPRQ